MLALATTVHAQQRPLITEDVDIIPPGSMRFEVGMDFLQNAKFPVSGLRGDLTRAGVIGINIGLSPNVEVQIEGVAQNFLSINSQGPSAIPLEVAPGANSTNDFGDFTLSTKIKLRSGDCERAVDRIPVRRSVTKLEPGARHRSEPDERLRSDTCRKEVRSQRAREHVRQHRHWYSHGANPTVHAERRDDVRRREHHPDQ